MDPPRCECYHIRVPDASAPSSFQAHHPPVNDLYEVSPGDTAEELWSQYMQPPKLAVFAFWELKKMDEGSALQLRPGTAATVACAPASDVQGAGVQKDQSIRRHRVREPQTVIGDLSHAANSGMIPA